MRRGEWREEKRGCEREHIRETPQPTSAQNEKNIYRMYRFFIEVVVDDDGDDDERGVFQTVACNKPK